MSNFEGKKIVLITRPLPDARAFAGEVKAAGFTPLIEPMLSILPLDYEIPDLPYTTLVFTSANAVRVFGCPSGMNDIIVFAVGRHTAEEARRQGYKRIMTSAEGDGAGLADFIGKETPPGTRILHIRGEHVAVPLEKILKAIKMDTLIVYTAKAITQFTPALRRALGNGNIGSVTFFSRRTAQNFLNIIEKEGFSGNLAEIKALCISESVLDCVRGASWQEAYSSHSPDRASMIDLMKSVL
jgi:uroporphyrinogen-III synthase